MKKEIERKKRVREKETDVSKKKLLFISFPISNYGNNFVCVLLFEQQLHGIFFPLLNYSLFRLFSSRSLTILLLFISMISMDEMCSPCADECWATLCVFFIARSSDMYKGIFERCLLAADCVLACAFLHRRRCRHQQQQHKGGKEGK